MCEIGYDGLLRARISAPPCDSQALWAWVGLVGLTADGTSMPLDLETRDSGTHRARPAIPGRHAPPSSWRHVWVCRAGTSIGMGWKGRAAKWELGLKSMVRM